MAEPNTIERSWLEFASNFPGMVENNEAKRMFYSGAINIVAMTFRVAQESPGQVSALFVRLRREIDDYFEGARHDNDVNGSRIILPH